MCIFYSLGITLKCVFLNKYKINLGSHNIILEILGESHGIKITK